MILRLFSKQVAALEDRIKELEVELSDERATIVSVVSPDTSFIRSVEKRIEARYKQEIDGLKQNVKHLQDEIERLNELSNAKL